MDARQIKAFFFDAMKQGWATPVKKIPIPQLPGSKSISFRSGELSLLDYYFVTPGFNSSYGTTVIWVAEIPVWIMHYGGFYDKQAISLLKAALRNAYSQDLFVGGRGPKEYKEAGNPLLYRNDIKDFRNQFGNFQGFEDIVNTENDEVLGEHLYFGGLLL